MGARGLGQVIGTRGLCWGIWDTRVRVGFWDTRVTVGIWDTRVRVMSEWVTHQEQSPPHTHTCTHTNMYTQTQLMCGDRHVHRTECDGHVSEFSDCDGVDMFVWVHV